MLDMFSGFKAMCEWQQKKVTYKRPIQNVLPNLWMEVMKIVNNPLPNQIVLVKQIVLKLPKWGSFMDITFNTVIRFYCQIIIPKPYREDACWDLIESFEQKSFGEALADLWKYTLSAADFYATWVMEIWMLIIFHVENSVNWLKSGIGIPKSEY